MYIGREPARMADRLQGPFSSFQYTLVDLREVDSVPLLASAEPSDNVLGILTRLAEPQRAVAHLVRRVAEEREPEQRTFYLEALLLLAGLRGWRSRSRRRQKECLFYTTF
ncbi:MAG: hypothetical protein ACJ73N_14335 [Bryobacteraceae bacterium]